MHGTSVDWGTVLLMHFVLLAVLATCAVACLVLQGLAMRSSRWPPLWLTVACLGASIVVAVVAFWLSHQYMRWFMWTVRISGMLIVVTGVVATVVRMRRLSAHGSQPTSGE